MNGQLNMESLSSQDRALLLRVLQVIKSVSYGTVQITIHDSEVVQIDKTEKIRIKRPTEGI